MQYDGLHRRIVKQVAHTGLDTDATFHYYYDTSWRLLETRYEYNGPTRKLAKHHVWGARYIDELIQIGINTDANDDCDAFYYAATNANFNVIGLIDGADGSLVERYEYTPYGRRTVYAKSGADDWLTSAPMWHSQLVPDKPYTLNDIGHQGLMHDRESGLVQNRYRYLDPRTGRWMTRDPIGYAGAMNLTQYVESSPTSRLDPAGLLPPMPYLPVPPSLPSPIENALTAWDVYWGLSDEGADFARALMLHFVIGGGDIFEGSSPNQLPQKKG